MTRLRQVRLDPTKDNPLPPGFVQVDTPVDFVKYALDDVPLFIRGDELCRWAEDFGKGRGWDCAWLASPVQSLLALCPALSTEEAKTLVDQMTGSGWELTNTLTIRDLLELRCGGSDLWAGAPSLDHAYSWLVWLAEQPGNTIETKLASQQARDWRVVAEPVIRRAYEATTSAEAWELLKEWLGVATPQQQWPSPPKKLSTKLLDRLKSDFTAEAITTATDFFPQLIDRAPEKEVLRIAASACAEVLIANPREATSSRIRRIEPYIPYDLFYRVSQLVEPEYPGLPEWRFTALTDWFINKYLPYRHWTVLTSDAENSGWKAEDAKAFAIDFLQYYADARTGGDGAAHLAWVKSARLRLSRSGQVHLLVVLDGLTYPDALRLTSHIERESQRLSVDVRELAIAPIPTVTEFAKSSVAKGLVPEQALLNRAEAICSSADDVIEALGKVSPGDVVVWTHAEPDRTYHWRADAGLENLRREVGAQLLTIGCQLKDIAESVPTEISLRIVITTDHGRLLKNAVRTQPVPPGMKAHGRAAWGISAAGFDESGIRLEGQSAYLHPGRFGLPANQGYVVNLSEDAYLTNSARGGSEPFPHGGLFPEEVLIPWIEFTRDRGPVLVRASLKGKGEEGKAGEAVLSITNLGQVRITVSSLSIQGLTPSIPIDAVVDPLNAVSLPVPIPSWPSKQTADGGKGVLTCLLTDGAVTKYELTIDLTTESLYEQDDILGELGGL